MIRLFDDNCEWTDQAREVSREASKKIREVYDQFPDYHIREIAHIIVVDAATEECRQKMLKDINETK